MCMLYKLHFLTSICIKRSLFKTKIYLLGNICTKFCIFVYEKRLILSNLYNYETNMSFLGLNPNYASTVKFCFFWYNIKL